jgi:hypothetical protein
MRSDDSNIDTGIDTGLASGPDPVEDDESNTYFLSGSETGNIERELLPESNAQPFYAVSASVEEMLPIRWKLPALVCAALLILLFARHIQGMVAHRAVINKQASILRQKDMLAKAAPHSSSAIDAVRIVAPAEDYQPVVIENSVAVPLYGNTIKIIDMPSTGRSDPFKPLNPLLSAGRQKGLSLQKKTPIASHAVSITPASPKAEGKFTNTDKAIDKSAEISIPAQEKVPPYRLEAVMRLQDKETALISEGEKAYVVNAGASLSEGYIVAAILFKSVILDKDGKRMELKL